MSPEFVDKRVLQMATYGPSNEMIQQASHDQQASELDYQCQYSSSTVCSAAFRCTKPFWSSQRDVRTNNVSALHISAAIIDE